MRKGGKRLRERRLCLQPAPKDHVHLALTLLYAGSAFRGLQLQTHSPTHHTVEGVLLQALRDVGVLDGLVDGKPDAATSTVHLARACRTDRGVHAVRNVVSLFVRQDAYEAAGAAAGLCARVNAVLPAAVRVACVTRVMGNFVPRHCCNRRVYRYLLPAYALLPPCDSWATMAQQYPASVQEAAEAGVLSQASEQHDEGSCASCSTHSLPYLDLDMSSCSNSNSNNSSTTTTTWRSALAAAVARCNALLREHYVGSHRFHNFTVDADGDGGGGDGRGRRRGGSGSGSGSGSKQVDANNEAAARVIYRCEVTSRVYLIPSSRSSGATGGGGVSYDEYVANCATASLTPTTTAPAGCSNTSGNTTWPYVPFVLFQVEGASFLFNMIRKMVGAAVAVCRGARAGLLAEALSPQRRVCTPLAPAAYLMLASSTYQPYDVAVRAQRRQQQLRQQQQQQQQHEQSEDGNTKATVSEVSVLRTPLCTLRRAMAGDVAAACERFATAVIYRDVVDADGNVLPPLNDLLAARDAARRVTRPRWVDEDSHLVHMKEYQPLHHGRSSSSSSSNAVVVGPMTLFLRSLRVHNWAVRDVALPADSKAMRELANRKRRRHDDGGEDKEGDDAGDAEAQAVAVDNGDNKDTDETDNDDDGWVYAAATTAEEARALCRAHAAAVRRSVAARYTRTWHNSSSGDNCNNRNDDITAATATTLGDDDDDE